MATLYLSCPPAAAKFSLKEATDGLRRSEYADVGTRVWPQGLACLRGKSNERIGKLKGTSTVMGVHKCYACRKPFVAKVGTMLESSHVASHLWLRAMRLTCASKKGISANQLHRSHGVTPKSAWFISHRIRAAVTAGGILKPMGAEGAVWD